MYLARCLAGPTTSPIRAIEDIESTLTRVLKAGLSNFTSNDVHDEETLENSRPGITEEDVIQLDPDDPRAADFRNAFRTYVIFSMPPPRIGLTNYPQLVQWRAVVRGQKA